jgi:hypothetical protein
MVHRRPLAEQIAFPGVSALRSEPFFWLTIWTSTSWFRGL